MGDEGGAICRGMKNDSEGGRDAYGFVLRALVERVARPSHEPELLSQFLSQPSTIRYGHELCSSS